MFSRQEELLRRTPKEGVNRGQYITQLVDEFLQTNSIDAKRQVLANLANFAYDPINYEFLREAGALDVFLNQISLQHQSEDAELTHFACSGLCNLCLDPINADYIVKYNGISLLISLLSSECIETKLNTITTLVFLSDRIPRSVAENPEVVKLFLQYKESSNDTRLKNLATVFIHKVIGDATVEDYKKSVVAIPLPS